MKWSSHRAENSRVRARSRDLQFLVFSFLLHSRLSLMIKFKSHIWVTDFSRINTSQSVSAPADRFTALSVFLKTCSEYTPDAYFLLVRKYIQATAKWNRFLTNFLQKVWIHFFNTEKREVGDTAYIRKRKICVYVYYAYIFFAILHISFILSLFDYFLMLPFCLWCVLFSCPLFEALCNSCFKRCCKSLLLWNENGAEEKKTQ